MTDIAEGGIIGNAADADHHAPLEGAEERRAEVEEFLLRARETVARTREVIAATRQSLGPAPGHEGAAAE